MGWGLTGLLTLIISSLFMLGYNYVSTDIRYEKEAWVYPAVSFIAELGGSLGLFVGFSFLTVWDCLDWALAKARSNSRLKQ